MLPDPETQDPANDDAVAPDAASRDVAPRDSVARKATGREAATGDAVVLKAASQDALTRDAAPQRSVPEHGATLAFVSEDSVTGDAADDSAASLLARDEVESRPVHVANRPGERGARPLPDVTAPETPVRAWMRRMRTRPRPWDYCWLTARTNLAVLRRAIADLPRGEGEPRARVVDIGCGAKPFAELLAGTDHLGVDFDGRTAADLVHDLGTPLPLPDGEADLVLLSEVLEHVPDPELVLAEAARVLKPGGQLFLSAPFAFPIHGRPWDYRRFTNYYYESVGERLPLELLELEASNNVFTTPLLLVNQLVLSAPGLPRAVKSAGWLALNLVSGLAELALRPWWRGDGRLGLFLRMNPSGYAARWRRRADTRD